MSFAGFFENYMNMIRKNAADVFADRTEITYIRDPDLFSDSCIFPPLAYIRKKSYNNAEP